MAPYPPPAGGIATWTALVLEEFRTRTDCQIDLLDMAVRWCEQTQLTPLRRAFGGSISALKNIMRLLKRLWLNRPEVLHICTSGGPASIKDLVCLWLARFFAVKSVIHFRMGRLAKAAEMDNLDWRL